MSLDSFADTAHYAAIITRCFPEVAVHSIEYLDDGWDFAAYLVNRELIFRFPRRPECARRLLFEMRLLPKLCPTIRLAVPDLKYAWPGDPPDRPFEGYPLIPGIQLSDDLYRSIRRPKLEERLARQIGEFNSDLHCFPAARAAELGAPVMEPLAEFNFYTRLKREVFPLLSTEERAWTQALYTAFLADERHFQFTPTLIHGDLSGDHILYDPQSQMITGVIDFTDCSIGDPAYDFAGLMSYGRDFVRRAMAVYAHRTDETFLERARFYHCRGPFCEIMGGLELWNPRYIEMGLEDLRKVMRGRAH